MMGRLYIFFFIIESLVYVYFTLSSTIILCMMI
jgi:hypothetical protein